MPCGVYSLYDLMALTDEALQNLLKKWNGTLILWRDEVDVFRLDPQLYKVWDSFLTRLKMITKTKVDFIIEDLFIKIFT